MKTLLTITCSLLLLSTLHANEGKELYVEANCHSCHGGDTEFLTMNGKVKNLENLKGWVSACATNLDTGWFPEEEEKVVKYLNETHYHLKK